MFAVISSFNSTSTPLIKVSAGAVSQDSDLKIKLIVSKSLHRTEQNSIIATNKVKR